MSDKNPPCRCGHDSGHHVYIDAEDKLRLGPCDSCACTEWQPGWRRPS